jgi:hypothetical protein
MQEQRRVSNAASKTTERPWFQPNSGGKDWSQDGDVENNEDTS